MMRRWIKWIGIVCLVPVALVLLVSILLYIPPIQDFAVREATQYASKATGMKVRIGQLRLSFPLDITAHDMLVVSARDTLLDLRSFSISIRPLPLLYQKVLIDAIDMQKGKVNSAKFIDGMVMKGVLGRLHAHADHIDLAKGIARFNKIDLSNSNIYLYMHDTTTVQDTTKTHWTLLLDKVNIKKVGFTLDMPDYTMRVGTFASTSTLTKGVLDLANSEYKIEKFELADSRLSYDGDTTKVQPGFNPFHIAFNHLNSVFENIAYRGADTKVKMHVKQFEGIERSGLVVQQLIGDLENDTATFSIPEMFLKTPNSEVRLLATVPWSSMDSVHPRAKMNVLASGTVGKQDLLLLAGPVSKSFSNAFPNQPLTFSTAVDGNFNELTLRQKAELPGVFKLDASGKLTNVRDSVRRAGDFRIDSETGNLNFFLAALPAKDRGNYHIPSGMKLVGNASLKNGTYHADFIMHEGRGSANLLATFNPAHETYEVNMMVDNLQITHFMPKDSLYSLSGTLCAEGRGFDPYRASTWAKVNGTLGNVQYGTSSVSDVSLAGSLLKHHLKVDLTSDYPLATLNMSLDGTFQKKSIDAILTADVQNLDLYGLHMMNDSLSTSFQIFAEVKTDMKKNNLLDVTLGNWELTAADAVYHPKTLTLHAWSTKDTTQVSFHAGDLGLTLTGNADLETMMKKFEKINEKLNKQLTRDSVINIPELKPLLPELHLEMSAGRDNPIYNALDQYDVSFNHMQIEASTSPTEGLLFDGDIFGLRRDTIRVDTICLKINQDSLGLEYVTRIVKKPFRKQSSFAAELSGKIRNTFADAQLTYADGKGETGVLLGVRMDKERDGLRFHLFPDKPIVAFHAFSLNSDNYILYRNKRDISANVRFVGEKNASLWIHSMPGEKHEELHAELSQIDLDAVTKGFTELPAMRGMFSADLQYAPTDSSFMIVADAHVDSLFYENGRVGEMGLNAVYLPLGGNRHQVDMHLFHEQEEISSMTAVYQSGKKDKVDGNLQITDLPMSMLTPFIPDNMAKLSGRMQGEMTVTGSSDKPVVNGYMKLDTSSVYVTAVGTKFRFDDKKIEVRDNLLDFNSYRIYGSGTNPFVIDGTIDFHDPMRMMADMTLTADNMQLMNAKRSRESLLYGKLLVDLKSTLKGPLDALVMRGDLQLMGGTDVTYVMQDSPLTVQDRLADLVKFVDFSDTLTHRSKKMDAPLPVGGLDMLLSIHVDQSVRVNADITPDQSSHISLEGGGDLTFQYTPRGDMFLNGRYTLSGGTVKYAMPVVPLKEFNIQNGSYLQWTGDPMDPYMNLTATERVRASVATNDQASRLVTFDVGVSIKQTLEKLAFLFVVSAPEDQTMQQELAKMDDSERSQIAVTMLVTGMYLNINDKSSGSGANLDMGSALNSFLQSEINNIAGSALKSVDISLGMEQYDKNGNASGGQRTDFSFRFAKRFYNDRISIVLGGRISTGADVNSGQAQPFIDNVSIEYRLDNTGTRYVKLFHDKNYESLLEGEITETGAGVVLRKKMNRLRELFIFKRNKVKPVGK
jgi:hypothetical protein